MVSELRNMIVADTHRAARGYARQYGVKRPTVITTLKALEGCTLSNFQLHMVNSWKWRKGLFGLLQSLATRENRPLSNYLAPGVDGVIRSISNPDGTFTDRDGRIVGGFGGGGAGQFTQHEYPLHPLMTDPHA